MSEEKVETKQIVALLYGVSGLGKSQTVRNLAVKYNRPIIQVNLSQVKDAFVGNTEKNTQEVFNIYKKDLYRKHPNAKGVLALGEILSGLLILLITFIGLF